MREKGIEGFARMVCFACGLSVYTLVVYIVRKKQATMNGDNSIKHDAFERFPILYNLAQALGHASKSRKTNQ